jgi:hypothetical protein
MTLVLSTFAHFGEMRYGGREKLFIIPYLIGIPARKETHGQECLCNKE